MKSFVRMIMATKFVHATANTSGGPVATLDQTGTLARLDQTVTLYNAYTGGAPATLAQTFQQVGESIVPVDSVLPIVADPIMKKIARSLQQIDQVAKSKLESRMQWIDDTTIKFNSVAEKEEFLIKLHGKYKEGLKLAQEAYEKTANLKSFEAVRDTIQREELVEATTAVEADAFCLVALGPCAAALAVGVIGIEFYATFYTDTESSNRYYEDLDNEVKILATDYKEFTDAILMLPPNFSFSTYTQVGQMAVVSNNIIRKIDQFISGVKDTLEQEKQYRGSRWNLMCAIPVIGWLCDPAVPASVPRALNKLDGYLCDMENALKSVADCGKLLPPNNCDSSLLKSLRKDAKIAMKNICREMHHVICYMPEDSAESCDDAPKCSKNLWHNRTKLLESKSLASSRASDKIMRSYSEWVNPAVNDYSTWTKYSDSMNDNLNFALHIVLGCIVLFGGAIWFHASKFGLPFGNIHYFIFGYVFVIGICIGWCMSSLITTSKAMAIGDFLNERFQRLGTANCNAIELEDTRKYFYVKVRGLIVEKFYISIWYIIPSAGLCVYVLYVSNLFIRLCGAEPTERYSNHLHSNAEPGAERHSNLEAGAERYSNHLHSNAEPGAERHSNLEARAERYSNHQHSNADSGAGLYSILMPFSMIRPRE